MSYSCDDHGVGRSTDLHTMPGSTHTAAAGHLKLEYILAGSSLRRGNQDEVRPIQIDGVERPRYRQHQVQKRGSLLAMPQGREPFRESG